MRIQMSRAGVLVLAGVVALLVAGGIAYATIPDSGGVFTACRLNGVGTIRLIDPSGPSSSLLSRCTQIETKIQWNQQGQPGQTGATGPAGPAGTSPTVAQLGAGDSHCSTGGAAITDANGSTAYVCNGADGQDGKSFSGTFTSPSGQFSLSVSDGGVQITGPGSSISLGSSGSVSINGGTLNTVADNQNVTVHNDRSEVIGHDATLAVLHDRTTVIDHDETVHVKHDRTQTVDNNETITVHGARTETVDRDQTTTVHGDRTETVDGNQSITVGGNRSETVGGSRSQSVGSNDTLTVGANRNETVGGSLSVHVGGQVDLRGSLVAINGGGTNCQLVARQGDLVSAAGVIATGSATVCVGP